MTPPTWLYFPAASAPWLPSDLASLVGWWDADDSATIFDAVSGGSLPANAGTIGRWEDKSGNGNHVTQSSSGLRPTYRTSAINSKGSVRFTSQALARSGDLNTTNVTVAVVTNQSAGNIRLVDKRGTGAAGNFKGWQLKPQISDDGWLADQGNGSFKSTNLSTTPSGSYILIGTSDSNASMYLNGTDRTNLFSSSGTVTDVNNANIDLTFGANSNGQSTQMMNGGDIGEIVIANAVLSTGDRQKLEGYLAHKWGLTGNLPGASPGPEHPYKNSPP